MWEKDTVQLTSTLKEKILEGKERIQGRKILKDDKIPDFIKNIFAKKIEKFLVSEKPFTIRPTAHFEINSDDIERISSRLYDILRERAVFNSREVEYILDEALVLRLNYIIKPVDTMRRLLFNDNKDRIETSKIKQILTSYSEILPYSEMLIQECTKLDSEFFKREEYDNIMAEILQRMGGEDPVGFILKDFSVLTEFLSEIKSERISRVDGKTIQNFLADRNHWNFRRAVEVEMKLGKDEFDAEELKVTLKRYLEFKEEFEKGKTELIEEVSTEQKEEVAEEEKKPTFEAVEEEGLEGWELDEVVVKEDEKEPEEVKEERPKAKKMRIIRRDQILEEEEEKKEDLVLEKQQESPEREVWGGLRTLIDKKTEKSFIKKLFGGDEQSYAQLMEKLENAESWRVAKILIDNELFKRDVDPFSREAIKLVDMVYTRYYPEEGIGER